GRGRCKYFSLAGSEVAQAVEALSELGVKQIPAAARDLRFARCCYDHLAGRLGVALTERLLQPRNTVLRELGIDLTALESSRRAPEARGWRDLFDPPEFSVRGGHGFSPAVAARSRQLRLLERHAKQEKLCHPRRRDRWLPVPAEPSRPVDLRRRLRGHGGDDQ